MPANVTSAETAHAAPAETADVACAEAADVTSAKAAHMASTTATHVTTRHLHGLRHRHRGLRVSGKKAAASTAPLPKSSSLVLS